MVFTPQKRFIPLLVYENVKKMMKMRGITASEIPEHQFKDDINYHKYVLIEGTQGSTKVCIVIVNIANILADFSNKLIKNLPLQSNEPMNIMIIIPEFKQGSVSQLQDNIRKDRPNIHLELVSDEKFLLSHDSHVFKVDAKILSPEEKEKSLKPLHINEQNLPVCLSSVDSLAIYLGARSGDVIRISSPSYVSPERLSYRYCI